MLETSIQRSTVRGSPPDDASPAATAAESTGTGKPAEVR